MEKHFIAANGDLLLIQLNHLFKKRELSSQKALLLVYVVSTLTVGSRRGASKSVSVRILTFLLLSQWGCARKSWCSGPPYHGLSPLVLLSEQALQ